MQEALRYFLPHEMAEVLCTGDAVRDTREPDCGPTSALHGSAVSRQDEERT